MMARKPNKQRALVLFTLLLGWNLSACSCTHTAPTSTWQTSTVYFGRNMGPSEGVSDADWAGFLKKTVTPEFPKGLTVVDGLGQYEAKNQDLIKERAKILILVHPREEKYRQKVERVIDRYKSQFKQESVMWVEAQAKVTFR